MSQLLFEVAGFHFGVSFKNTYEFMPTLLAFHEASIDNSTYKT
jgi:hypothetical protein